MWSRTPRAGNRRWFAIASTTEAVAHYSARGVLAGYPYLDAGAAAAFVGGATDYHLTNAAAPGGRNLVDVANDPADVRLVVTEIRHLQTFDADLQRTIDPKASGVLGGSAGALV